MIWIIRLAVLFLVLLPAFALAHDHWINHGGYKTFDPVPLHCCGKDDCHKLNDYDVIDQGDSFYIIPLAQEWLRKHSYQSEDGHYWYCALGTSFKCFFYKGGGV